MRAENGSPQLITRAWQDVYSLGICLWKLLVGCDPLERLLVGRGGGLYQRPESAEEKRDDALARLQLKGALVSNACADAVLFPCLVVLHLSIAVAIQCCFACCSQFGPDDMSPQLCVMPWRPFATACCFLNAHHQPSTERVDTC